ncbi:2-dehydro-3-deoxygalactonokinase [Roseiarcus sp.]|uniref:2-dehydro-3-deoxygalactonokinase n=1 Tax=Roseiarcus sp. TaxID=1969460 RepID=UPI003C3EC4A1
MVEHAPALIALDWGSSSFRAYLMSREGDVLDEIESADGVSTIAPHAFPATLERLAGGWFLAYPGLPIIASGMIGSRHGWREAPYVRCPAEPRDIAANLTPVGTDEREVHLAPGLAYEDESGQPDVMRGEEVQILGIASAGARLVVLPGSHSKWASVDRGRILSFKTFVTGELFAAVKDHTLAGAFARVARSKPPGAAFQRGAADGAAATLGEKNAGLLGSLFGARSLPLMGKLAEDDAGDYLSGLLIGAEIAEARRLFADGTPHVAGAEALVHRYLAAFDALGLKALAVPPRAAARGLHLLARAAGLIR